MAKTILSNGELPSILPTNSRWLQHRSGISIAADNAITVEVLIKHAAKARY